MAGDLRYAAQLDAVNLRCIEIIDEILSIGRFAAVEFVLQVLLQRYGVSEFKDLGVGNMRDIPALFLLIEIHQKVYTPCICLTFFTVYPFLHLFGVLLSIPLPAFD